MRMANMARDLPESLKALSLGEGMGNYEFMADIIADLDEAGTLPRPGSQEAELLAKYRERTIGSLELQARIGQSFLKKDHRLNVIAAFLIEEISKYEQ